MSTISEALALAVANQQAGRLDVAEQIYGQILRVEPNHCDALHLLGVLAHQRGRHEVAVSHLRRAIAIDKRQPHFHNNAGEAYRAMGRLDEAAACYRRALALKPDFAAAHANLGIALYGQGHLDEAEASFRRAVELRPDFAAAHCNLGIVLHGQRKLAEAVACYRRAVELAPGFVQALCNLGNARSEQHALDEAATCYRRVLQLQPNFVEAYSNLAYVLREQGQLDEAESCCRQALQLDPELAQVHCNLGAALQLQERPDEAIACYRRAVELQPDFAEAYSNLGSAHKDAGRLAEAVACYRRALEIDPQRATTHSNLLCALLYSPNEDAQAIYAEHRLWHRRHAAALRRSARPHANVRSANRPLRVGYVSPDLRNHVVGWNVQPLLRHHDHRQYEICCYADVPQPDHFTEQLRSSADRWTSIVGWSDAQLADKIRADGIDILVDLALHMAGNRLSLFARKPAPVQVTFAGYPGTTGLSAIDYRLTDRYLDPPGAAEEFYAEESVRLDSFWCYEPLAGGPPVADLPALERGYVTFGCLSNFCKINPSVLALWAQVLKTVDRSRLTLLAPQGDCRRWALDLLEQEGVERDRVAFVDARARPEYLALYHGIDIGLDTLPYNGHTTSLDSFWMGVPVVSLVGRTVVGRAGLSMLTNLGLPDLAADQAQDFVHTAARMAADLPGLAQLRAGLRQRMQQSPLMDAPGFARGIEAAYRRMWHRWCATGPDNQH
jgi:predicted O-linked N-acetylglucosamine transferase (SPINDLY family)